MTTIGRPKKGETREKLKLVGFKADQSTLADLVACEGLIRDVPELGRRSEVLRLAIRELRQRLEKMST